MTKTSISEDITHQIIDLMASGHLKPGQRLPSERELCKEFGASRSSLREALRCLSIVGILRARVGDGTSVAPDGEKFLENIIKWRTVMENHEIEDLMEVRIGLECVAAANAARRGSDAHIAQLEELVEKMKAEEMNQKRFLALDLDFHLTLAKSSDNALLLDLVSLMRGLVVRGLAKALIHPKGMPLSLREHLVILRAIKRRDPEAARDAMQTHLQAALDRYHDAEEKRLPSRAKQLGSLAQ